MIIFRTSLNDERKRLGGHKTMTIIDEIIDDIIYLPFFPKTLRLKIVDWKALNFDLRRYERELASHKIAEDYLVELITDYPGEDQQKATMRNSMVQTQQTIKNLELLLVKLWSKKRNK